MLLKYIGSKPKKNDSGFNTGVIWYGNGDLQEVDPRIGRVMVLKHPDVWVIQQSEDSEKSIKMMKIKSAILSLDPDDSQQVTQNGLPRVNIVEELCEMEVTSAEIKEAIEEINIDNNEALNKKAIIDDEEEELRDELDAVDLSHEK